MTARRSSLLLFVALLIFFIALVGPHTSPTQVEGQTQGSATATCPAGTPSCQTATATATCSPVTGACQTATPTPCPAGTAVCQTPTATTTPCPNCPPPTASPTPCLGASTPNCQTPTPTPTPCAAAPCQTPTPTPTATATPCTPILLCIPLQPVRCDFCIFPCSVVVNAPHGWNLLAGPTGTTLPLAEGNYFTLKAGDVNYETIPGGTPLTAGEAVWAYLDIFAEDPIVLPQVPPSSVSVPLQAGGYVMAGNPGCNVALANGADQMLLFSPTTGAWRPESPPFILAPGQGALFFSSKGGTMTISDIIYSNIP